MRAHAARQERFASSCAQIIQFFELLFKTPVFGIGGQRFARNRVRQISESAFPQTTVINSD
jgi:hypothetical protein